MKPSPESKEIREETRRALFAVGAEECMKLADVIAEMAGGTESDAGRAAKEKFERDVAKNSPATKEQYQARLERMFRNNKHNGKIAMGLETLHDLQGYTRNPETFSAYQQHVTTHQRGALNFVKLEMQAAVKSIEFQKKVVENNEGEEWQRAYAYWKENPRLVTRHINPYAGIAPEGMDPPDMRMSDEEIMAIRERHARAMRDATAAIGAKRQAGGCGRWIPASIRNLFNPEERQR